LSEKQHDSKNNNESKYKSNNEPNKNTLSEKQHDSKNNYESKHKSNNEPNKNSNQEYISKDVYDKVINEAKSKV